MNREPKDELIGLIVIGVAIGLSLIAGGVSAVMYSLWFIASGLIIFALLRRKNKGSTFAAIVLLPVVIFTKFLPKQVRDQLKGAEKRSDKK